MTFLNIQIYAKQEKEVEFVETFAFLIANFNLSLQVASYLWDIYIGLVRKAESRRPNKSQTVKAQKITIRPNYTITLRTKIHAHAQLLQADAKRTQS